jgi:KDO2-lipid IV(A) lauroyltransferase
LVLDPRPKILVSGHFGNFELAGFITGLFGISTTAIARPLDNGFVHEYIDRFRSCGGQFMLSKSGSSSQVEALLAKGGALSLLADQYGGPKGCWVEFLGQLASCHKALALFTLSSGAPMMVCSNIRTSRPLHFKMSILGLADPQQTDCPDSILAMTKWYNQCLEGAIRATPSQYWWVHHRWKGTPPAKAIQANKVA